MRLPRPLELAKAAGLAVFGTPFSANLVVVRGPGKPDDWDGLLTLSWCERPGGAWTTMSAPCATRPGTRFLRHPMHPRGTAVIQPGQFRLSHARGFHHAGTPQASPAWVLVGKVWVKRDGNTNEELDAPSLPVDDATGVNIHRIGDPAGLAGCIGVEAIHLDPILEAFDELAVRYPQRRVSLTVVEG